MLQFRRRENTKRQIMCPSEVQDRGFVRLEVYGCQTGDCPNWKLRPGEVWMIFKSKAPPAENEKWASLYDLLKGSKDE